MGLYGLLRLKGLLGPSGLLGLLGLMGLFGLMGLMNFETHETQGTQQYQLIEGTDMPKICVYLRDSSSTDRLLAFVVCRLGGSSSPCAARHCICVSTMQKHLRAVLQLTNVVIQSGWFPPQKASHRCRNSFPRDKARLPGLNMFRHSWLRVRRWPAQSCCSCDSN